MPNPRHTYGRRSLVSIVIISFFTTVHYVYHFGLWALLLGLAAAILPTLAIMWYRKKQTALPAIAYGIAGGSVVIGFGLIEGLWGSTLKLFIENFLPGQYFSWDPVGSFLFEATGVLASIAALFAGYYLMRFISAVVSNLRSKHAAPHAYGVPTIIVLSLALVTYAFLA